MRKRETAMVNLGICALWFDADAGFFAQRRVHAAQIEIEKNPGLKGVRCLWPDASDIVATRTD